MRKIKIVLLSIFFFFAGMFLAQASPQRIISLAPSFTEELYLIGAEDQLVGITTYCPQIDATQFKEKVGNIVEVNLEKVVALEPDMVLATSLTNIKLKNKLRSLGIEVVDFPQAKNFSQICEQFLRLGEIVGRSEKAGQIIWKTKQEIAVIEESVAGIPKQKVFIQVGTNPLFTMNKDYFINDIIKLAGGINIAENASSGLYSREKVVEANPDVSLS